MTLSDLSSFCLYVNTESKENGVEYQNVKNKELDETKFEMKTLEKTPSAPPRDTRKTP